MSQPGHDPHSYNPMTNQRHLQGAILLAINVNTDTSNQIDLYQYSRHDLRLYISTRTYISCNTIIKAESQIK